MNKELITWLSIGGLILAVSLWSTREKVRYGLAPISVTHLPTKTDTLKPELEPNIYFVRYSKDVKRGGKNQPEYLDNQYFEEYFSCRGKCNITMLLQEQDTTIKVFNFSITDY